MFSLIKTPFYQKIVETKASRLGFIRLSGNFTYKSTIIVAKCYPLQNATSLHFNEGTASTQILSPYIASKAFEHIRLSTLFSYFLYIMYLQSLTITRKLDINGDEKDSKWEIKMLRNQNKLFIINN